MADYVGILKLDKYVEVMFQAGARKIMDIGEKMNAVCGGACMNGYNWDALLRYYLEKNAPDILTGIKTDPEADMYVAYWPLSPENEARARRFEEIIRSLVEHEEELCRLVKEHGGEIEWD